MKKTDDKILKYLYKIIVILLLIGLIVFLLHKCNSKKQHDGDEKLKIDKTENVVVEIRKLNEFVTAVYYEELVLHYSKKSTKLIDKRKDEIVILAKGKVRAGFDLQKVQQKDIQVTGDTLTLEIPKSKILDVIINPSDFEIYEEDGKWSQTLVADIQSEARNKLRSHSLTNNILEKADAVGKERLTTVLQSIGFSVVIVNLY